MGEPSNAYGRSPTRCKEHGLTEEPGEGYTGRLILPEWWDDIRPPAHPCPWCQRHGSREPVPRMPGRPRGHPRTRSVGILGQPRPSSPPINIASAYGIDPWQCPRGEPEPASARCRIYVEHLDVTPEGDVSGGPLLWYAAAPRGIYWGTRAAGV